MNTDPKSLHQQFLILGRERNRITYKLLSLLPQIYKQKVYESYGYATIYEYAGKLAGLSYSVVEKALKLEEKLKDKPNLQKAIETQGIHKVAIIANIATPENEKMFADKVENMSKPALQQFSRECRGKIQTTFQIELDIETMETFLKLKKEMKSENLSNKEALRRMLKMLGEKNAGKLAHEGKRDVCLQPQAKNSKDFPGEKVRKQIKITRYVPIAQKREVLAQTNGLCSHENCHNPAQIFHHRLRFSQTKSHKSVIPLCKIHHEFAHNGITETMTEADECYREYRQKVLF